MAKQVIAIALLLSLVMASLVHTIHADEEDECTEEGFFPNLEDCTKFYRCVKDSDGKFTKFDFDCGPGTVYDPDLITCNHPWAVDPKSPCYKPFVMET